MKLNLGCGGDYKKDYLNVDAFDSNVADEIMESTNLKIEDNKVDGILLSQLIEHLGIVGSLYTLSECFRVLKPGKKLIIETPDLKKSFENYLHGDREARKNLLPWIYGVDIPGMVHRFCYPEDLLHETLQDMGFINIKKEYIETDKYQPTLKVICEKPENYRCFQIMTYYRKKILTEGVIDLNDQLTSLEKEKLVDIFTKKTCEIVKKPNLGIVKKTVAGGAVNDPKMTLIYLEKLMENDLISGFDMDNYVETLNALIQVDFPNVLLKILMETDGYIGEQEQLYKIVYNMGMKTVERLLDSDEKDEIINKLRDKSKEISQDEKISFFSPKMIMLKGNRFFQIGAKHFFLSEYEKAIDFFTTSCSIYRNQVLTFWNLGRLFSIQKQAEKAASFYKNALRILEKVDYDNKTSLVGKIQQELRDVSKVEICEPVVSMN